MEEFCICKIECLANKRVYIGRTENYETRKRHHLAALRSCRHINEEMQHDFNKYGEENFSISVIDHAKRKRTQMNGCIDGDAERRWMAYYRSSEKEHGYNYKEHIRSDIKKA